MSHSIAEYFIDEQDDWTDTIRFDVDEAEELQEWLQKIVHFNTVPKLEASVEHHFNQLSLCKQNLLGLQNKIDLLKEKLYKQQRPVDNDLVTEVLMGQQKELRKNMFGIEREFLEVKYSTNHFLSETIAKQNFAGRK